VQRLLKEWHCDWPGRQSTVSIHDTAQHSLEPFHHDLNTGELGTVLHVHLVSSEDSSEDVVTDNVSEIRPTLWANQEERVRFCREFSPSNVAWSQEK
jgi:tRNA G37 N-methylase Trm5